MKKVIHTLGSYEKAMKNIYDIVKPEYDKKGYISDKEILSLIFLTRTQEDFMTLKDGYKLIKVKDIVEDAIMESTITEVNISLQGNIINDIEQ
jgi:hypothetical protein